MKIEDWKKAMLSLKRQMQSPDYERYTQEEIEESFNRLVDEAKKHLGSRLQQIKLSTGSVQETGRKELIREISDLIDYLSDNSGELIKQSAESQELK